MKLTGDEFSALHEALGDAFEYDELEVLLAKSGHKLANITQPKAMPTVVLKVIEFAERRDWVDGLIAAARSANLQNRQLAAVAAAIGLEPAGVPVSEAHRDQALSATSSNLERLVNASRKIADFGSYAAKISELVRRVCAIEVGTERGTGFLIGPETVLTNHHVVAKAINGNFDPAHIVLRFDYRRLRDGKTTNAGVEYRLASGNDWLVDAERHSAADTTTYNAAKLPAANELDYAVLRTKDPVGRKKSSAPARIERGWIEPLDYTYDFPDDSMLMIVQHPCNDPISFDAPDDAVVRVNPNKTRVHYRVNTMPGSSGSPVLNADLELVAIHHAGEPGSPDHWKPCKQQVTPAAYNEGVPIATIRKHLDEVKKKGWVFGGNAP